MIDDRTLKLWKRLASNKKVTMPAIGNNQILELLEEFDKLTTALAAKEAECKRLKQILRDYEDLW